MKRLLATAAFGLWLGLAQAAMVDRVAAVVNDDVITLSEIYELGGPFIEERVQAGGPGARRAAELEVLETQIQRKLISQEIARLALDVTDEELRRALANVVRGSGLDEAQFRAEVERAGLSWSAYLAEARESLRFEKFKANVLVPRVNVNEDEVRDAWRRAYSGADQPMVQDLGAIHLRFPDGADDAARAEVLGRASAVRARLAAGEPFATVAAEVDEGPFKAQGGRMGTFRQGELVPELEGPVSALAVGGVSEPVVMSHGVFLLTVFDRRAADPPPFDEVRGQLTEQVYGQRIEEELEQWLQSARRRAAVAIKLESGEGA